jgi:hypothetical protein
MSRQALGEQAKGWNIGHGTGVSKRFTFITWEANANTGVTSTRNIEYTNTSWIHIVAVRNSTSATNSNLSIWINGINENSIIGTTRNLSTGRNFTMGHYNWNYGTDNYNGALDEVIIFNRSLTKEEILELYNNRNPPSYPFTPEIPSNNCTYVSNNWIIPCSDTCNLTATNLMGKNITLYGTGTIRGFRNVSNYTYGLINNGCHVIN